eukprot:10599369-Alexandrium_andersonii.AAC.1
MGLPGQHGPHEDFVGHRVESLPRVRLPHEHGQLILRSLLPKESEYLDLFLGLVPFAKSKME